MAGCYLSSGRIAERENSPRNVRIRTNYGSLIDKFLAETAIPAEKRLNSKGAASDCRPRVVVRKPTGTTNGMRCVMGMCDADVHPANAGLYCAR